ncbi:hypothetical protein HAALTHF_26700n [Vreelandella aquamarina]|nr:hypothetical protein HAALTHF_26700n [Halomonas axialensis]
MEYGHNGLLLIPLFMFAMQALSETRNALKSRLWAGASGISCALDCRANERLRHG